MNSSTKYKLGCILQKAGIVMMVFFGGMLIWGLL